MCLADIVDDDTDSPGLCQPADHLKSLSTSAASRTAHTKADNYHLYLASRPTPAEEPLEEEPYRLERGRKRHTLEEDEGEVTETDDLEGDDAEMDIDQPSTISALNRPIRPIKRNAGFNASSQTHSTASPSTRSVITPCHRQLGGSRSAPLSALPLSFDVEPGREDMRTNDLSVGQGLEGGVGAWVGRTDF